jgi:hypothetical protein
MTLANRGDLVDAISSYLWDRDDILVQIPTFIKLAEAEMNRRLSVRKKFLRVTLTVDAEYVDLPDDYGGIIALELNTDPPVQPRMMTPDGLMQERAGQGTTTGKPYAVAIVGDQLRFFYAPDDSHTAELQYYQGLTALVADADTNWILDKHPDAYLYGALVHSAPWLRDDERLSPFGTLFTAIMEDIVTQSQLEELGPAMQMMPSTVAVE